MFKDLMKNLKSKSEQGLNKLKQKLNKKGDDFDDFDDDDFEAGEELFSDEDETAITDDDEKTVVTNLDEFNKSNIESDSTETVATGESGESDSFQSENESTNIDSFSSDESTNIDNFSSDETSSFDEEDKTVQFNADELDSEFDEDDDEFESESGSPDIKSMVIRGVAALVVVYIVVDEFILTDEPEPIVTSQKMERTKRIIKKKKVQPIIKEKVEEEVVEKVAEQIPEKVEVIADVEPSAESQMEGNSDTDESNNETVVTNDEESNVKSETLNDEMNEGKDEAPMDQTSNSMADMEKEQEPVAVIEKEENEASSNNIENMNEEKSSTNMAKMDEETGSSNIELMADETTKQKLKEMLEKAQDKIASLEENKKENSRQPASMASSEKAITINDFKINNSANQRSKDTLTYIKAMIPVPADVKKYEYTETLKFSDSDYGRGLVYNCVKQHWACVSKKSYFQCRDHARWSLANSKSPKCVINSVHASLKSCSVSQLIRIEQLSIADFCNYESDREPATTEEIGEEGISYEEGL